MGEVTAHGRSFKFDDNVPEAERQTRIKNWMQLHAPDELRAPAANAPAPAPTRTAMGNVKEMLSNPLSFWGEAKPKAMAHDTGNFVRTVAQGALPFADEGIAGIRSLMGTDYDTALADERGRLKEFGDQHGKLAQVATELGGAALSIPLTMGAGSLIQGTKGGLAAANLLSKAPGASTIANLAAKYPGITQALVKPALTGGASGAAAGFGAGEGGFDARVDNAKTLGAVGAGLGPLAVLGTNIVRHADTTLRKDSAVANFLRKRLMGEHGDDLAKVAGMPKTRLGDIDVSHPDFANLATDDLAAKLTEKRRIARELPGSGKSVIAADVLPETAEQIVQRPGQDTTRLGRTMMERQYNASLPEAEALANSQFGRVTKAMDRSFGPDVFRRTDDQLNEHIQQEAARNFAPAYAQNIRTTDVADAINDPFVRKAWRDAEEKMVSQRKPVGTMTLNPDGTPTGNYSDYNTEFLHTVKRTMDDMATAARSRPEGTTGKDTARIIGSAKERLNQAMRAANDPYRHAMDTFGEEASVIQALKEGREGVFGRNMEELDKGMGAEDLIKYLADPSKTQAQKDMFRQGAARALRANLLGSDTKKFTHNWADVLNAPNMAEKYKALIDPAKPGAWDLMRAQMGQMSDQYKSTAQALGNSRTARRLELSKELDPPNMIQDVVATAVNPTAPSGWRAWASRMIPKGDTSANTVANLLAKSGPRGNREAVQEIKNLLNRYQGREAAFKTFRNAAPPAAGWAWPERRDPRQNP